MELLRTLAELNGFFTRAQAIAAGHEDKELTAGVRHGVLIRFRRGYYTFADLWAALDEVAKHLVRLRAVLDSLGPAVAASHVSGALLHGITTWGVPLDRVHVTRLDGGASRIEGDVVHHVGSHPGRRRGRGGRPTGRCARTDARSSAPRWAPRSRHWWRSTPSSTTGWAPMTSCVARFEQMEHWPRTRHLHVPVRMADAGADGAGESRGRWLFRLQGVPAPVVQYEVHAADGTLLGTTDWGWPAHGVLGEFDGRVKYGRLLRPGQEPGDVVFAEKQREDLLRETTGSRMVRLVWEDLGRPRLTGERVRRQLRRGG